MELKLARLPDRIPVKVSVTVSPQLARKLALYAELYNEQYSGSSETVADLVPYMLESFLDADREFVKAFKEREATGEVSAASLQIHRRKRRSQSSPQRPASEE